MTLYVAPIEEFPEDVLTGEWADGMNKTMVYVGSPVLSSINMCYRVPLRVFEEEQELSEETVLNGKKWCYTSWGIGKHVQVIPTYRPRTFAKVAAFLAEYQPPIMQDHEMIVRPSAFKFTSAMLAQYPYCVEMQLEYPPVEDEDSSYPRRAWLTWLSWLRGAWEFLPVEEEFDTAMDVLMRAWEMQEWARDIHYPLYRPSQTGQVGPEHVLLLLEKLKEGYYEDGSLLQDQGKELLPTDLPTVEWAKEVASTRVRMDDEDDYYEEADIADPLENFDDYDPGLNLGQPVFRAVCGCECADCKRTRRYERRGRI
jgi:hypothetical protein